MEDHDSNLLKTNLEQETGIKKGCGRTTVRTVKKKSAYSRYWSLKSLYCTYPFVFIRKPYF